MTGYDQETEKWFQSHLTAETTVMQCDRCGLFFKPSLGHKCRKDTDNEQAGKKKTAKTGNQS